MRSGHKHRAGKRQRPRRRPRASHQGGHDRSQNLQREAHGLVKDTESLALWKSRRDELFAEIERLDVKTRGQAGIRVIGADAVAREPVVRLGLAREEYQGRAVRCRGPELKSKRTSARHGIGACDP